MRAITTDPNYWVIKHRLIVLTHEGGEKGRRYPGGLITLRSDLNHVNRRCTLMHEIGHHIHGDTPTTDSCRSSRQERRAHEWAAQHLISEQAYRDAETIHGPHIGALAAELEVTTKYIEIWREMHARIANYL